MALLIHLLKCKKTTYGELARQFEVSVKTIERDIDRLSAMGIPVYCTQGAGGGVHLDEHYKFGTSFFTEWELHQIIFALKIMDSLSETPVENTILDKLCLIAPELSALFASDAETYLSIDLLTEKVGPENWVCAKIDFCLDNEVLAEIDGVRVAPIGYVLKPDGLYLFCFSEGYRLLKCREMQTIVPTDIDFLRDFISYETYKRQLH
ncbi:MAG: HTH domain-containing protein [Oscillospiraceae bacterium]